ncbi:MAG TPA: LuxR C-terminal-related transcriptional regulator [Mycobacteriales bacterium]
MTHAGVRGGRGLAPLLLSSVVVVLVSLGQARGLWLPNLHNGLLAVAFTFVGAYVLHQRPRHREGRLFLATGVTEALLFFGRQIGHFSAGETSPWWGWLGVWPTAVALALTTLSVLCFPDGRLPSLAWRWVAAVVVALAAACALLSAVWPVEYASTGLTTRHPLQGTVPSVVASFWSALAHPLYAGMQVLWVVAVADRWRRAGRRVRRQLTWLVGAAGLSVAALVAGLLAVGTPRAGLLAAALVPVAAGWAIVHGQHVTSYSALTWLSRADDGSYDRPTALARAVADALSAPAATLWMGGVELHAVGVWPESDEAIAPSTRETLEQSTSHHVRVVVSKGSMVGVLAVRRARADALSLTEARLFGDLASQAALVIDHLGLAEVIGRQERSGHVEALTPREREVLALIARGHSNAAICRELHLSIKTVEPIVGAIFDKLELHADAATNRRVLAALAYSRT